MPDEPDADDDDDDRSTDGALEPVATLFDAGPFDSTAKLDSVPDKLPLPINEDPLMDSLPLSDPLTEAAFEAAAAAAAAACNCLRRLRPSEMKNVSYV